MKSKDVQKALQALADPGIALHSARFFKTGPGEYGEGDQFLGIRVPDQRKTAKKFKLLSLEEISALLKSAYHEERLTGLFILVLKFEEADSQEQKTIYDFYVEHLACVNNWDLVDSSAYKIAGPFLENRPRDVLYEWAASDNLWKRRVSVITTLHFIKNGDYGDTLELARRLINDEHDLIHKAAGWMLREVGNRNREVLENFLDQYCNTMPRTMLRYAIEKLPRRQREQYLSS